MSTLRHRAVTSVSPRGSSRTGHRILGRAGTLATAGLVIAQLLTTVAPVAAAVTPAVNVAVNTGVVNGSYVGFPTQQSLTAAGTTDWRVWGKSSTSLTGDARKSAGAGISGLTDVIGSPVVSNTALRALGSCCGLTWGNGPNTVPFAFQWTDGTPTTSASRVLAGLQHYAGSSALVGYGFSFTVPASTARQRLTLWVDAHHGTGQLTVTLGSVTKTDTSITGGENVGGIYTIDYSGDGTAGQTLSVKWVLKSVGSNSNAANVAIHAAALSPAPDFSIAASPSSVSMAVGTSTTSAVSLTALNGLTGSVALGASTSNPALSASLNPATYVLGTTTSSTLTMTAGSGLAPGSYSVTVTGTQGSISHSTTVGVTVTSDFTIAASPGTLNVAQGSSATSTINVTGVNGTTGTVGLSAGGSPAGLTVGIPASYVLGSSPSPVLTVGAGALTNPGTYVVTVTATLGSVQHQTAVTVMVPTPSPVGVPLLTNAYSPAGSGRTYYAGHISAAANTQYQISFDSAGTCPNGAFPAGASGNTLIGSTSVTTDSLGNAFFSPSVPTTTDPNGNYLAGTPGAGQSYIAAQVTGPAGRNSSFSPCVVNSPDNSTWTRAFDITPNGTSVATGNYIDQPGVGRWFKFHVDPGQSVTLTLTGLSIDDDVYLFKDIAQTYSQLTGASLTTLSAQFAGSGFSGSGFSGSGFSGSGFSGSGFSGSGFSADTYSGSGFSGSGFSGSGFSGSGFSGSGFSGSGFSGSGFSGSGFSGSGFSGSGFSAQDFSAAQVYSLIGWSNNLGIATEHITANTWTTSGDFYIRVNGKNGASDLSTPFTLSVTDNGSDCAGVAPSGTAPGPIANTYGTLILTDTGRLEAAGYPAADITTMQAKLASLAAATNGVVIDLAGNSRVQTLQAQADANAGCVYAENLVASAIKDVILAYRTGNTSGGVKDVVLAGGDSVIPYFRYPDTSSIGPELNYFPPVQDNTPSQASLRDNYVLGQDAYGSTQVLTVGPVDFPIPDLPVGRLVESPGEIGGMVDAFLALANSNYAITPSTSLVTGYDFVADDAAAVKANFQQGTGATPDSLISNYGVAPSTACDTSTTLPDCSWSATQLTNAFLGSRHDISFLAGHFSANAALAADFSSVMTTADFAGSQTDFQNSLILSIGCHSGYNIVDGAAVSGVTQPLDWAQAFAQKGATAVLGTGYQYGDTDFIAYSERFYDGLSQQLLYGQAGTPVQLGNAMVAAKIQYLKDTPGLGDLHVKALLEAALYGIPMFGVNMPNRIPTPGGSGIVTPSPVPSGFGTTTGLQSFDLTESTPSPQHLKTLNVLDASGNVTSTLSATYYTAPDGSVIAEPGAPVIPLYTVGVASSTPGYVLRGVGFRGGSFADSAVVPLTGAPGTELGTAHTSFDSPTFFPNVLASPNYFGDLSGTSGTTLMIAGAQHQATIPGSDTVQLRLYSSESFRLFYSNSPAAGSASAAPVIYGITSALQSGGSTSIAAHVVGDPNADIQEVWVTYTTPGSETWQSLELVRDTTDPTLWSASPTLPANTLFMVQAVNGYGLVTLNDNGGSYYVAGNVASVAGTGNLTVSASTGSTGVYGSTETVTATLTVGGAPVSSKQVIVSLGSSVASATTNSSGQVTIQFPLLSAAGPYQLSATFLGSPDVSPAGAASAFTITPAASTVTVACPTSVYVTGLPQTPCTAVVTGADLNQPLPVTYSGNTAVGTATASATFYGDAAHSGSTGSAGFSITLPTLTITASSGSMTYGGTAPAITPSYSGFVNGDTAASLTTPPTCSTTATGSPVGSYPTTCSGAVDPNYAISYVAGSVAVGQAPLAVTASDGTSSYGTAPGAITPSYSGFVNGDGASSLTTSPTCSTTATKSSPVGHYPTSCTGAVDPNYAISYVDGTLSVVTVPLTITASSGSMSFGGTVPTITAGYSGFVNGDTASSLTTQPSCSTTATSASTPGTYSTSCSGAVDANYAISYSGGTVTIGQGSTTTSVAVTSTYAGTPLQFSDSATITATVTPNVAGGTLSGTVSFTIDGNAAGSAALVAGSASVTVRLDQSRIPGGAGNHTFGATFTADGSSSYAGSSGSTPAYVQPEGRVGTSASPYLDGSARLDYTGDQFVNVGTAPTLKVVLHQSLSPEAVDGEYVDFSKVNVPVTFTVYKALCSTNKVGNTTCPSAAYTVGPVYVQDALGWATSGDGTASAALPSSVAVGTYVVIASVGSPFIAPEVARSTLEVSPTGVTEISGGGWVSPDSTSNAANPIGIFGFDTEKSGKSTTGSMAYIVRERMDGSSVVSGTVANIVPCTTLGPTSGGTVCRDVDVVIVSTGITGLNAGRNGYATGTVAVYLLDAATSTAPALVAAPAYAGGTFRIDIVDNSQQGQPSQFGFTAYLANGATVFHQAFIGPISQTGAGVLTNEVTAAGGFITSHP